jgi:hypothetical protein
MVEAFHLVHLVEVLSNQVVEVVHPLAVRAFLGVALAFGHLVVQAACHAVLHKKYDTSHIHLMNYCNTAW